MPFDPTDPNSLAANQYVSPLAGMAQDRATGMLNQPQLKVFAKPQAAPFQDAGTNFTSPIMPSQTQLGNMMPGTLSMAKGGLAKNEGDDLAGIKNTIRAEFAARGLDFDKFIANPAVMDEVGKSIQSHGKNGDTILAHINPEEAKLLKEHGGSGSINPHTGLPQFDNPSMGSYDAPSSSSDYSGYTGGSNIGSYSGSGNTTYSPSTGGTTTSPTMGGYLSTSGGGGKTVARPVSPTPATAGEIYAQNLSKSGAVTSLPTSTASPFFSTSSATSAPKPVSTQNTVSPVGFTGNPLTMGQAQPIVTQTPSPQPTFANVDPATGMPLGGSNLSGIGTLAAASAIGGEAPASTYAPSVSPIDPSVSPVGLSDIDFSSMNAGVAPNAYVPGGISNFAAAPTDPGYTDIGLTAMRMAANQPTGAGYRSQGTEFNLGKLNEFDPVAQTQGATILNRMMDEGYSPGFDPYGVGRTMAEQAALKAAAGNNLTAAPGRSFHNYGLAMDVENLPEQGYRDLSRIAGEEGWGWGGSLDPAHVQAAPWGAGAMQTAMALGAQPFTGEGRIPESPTALQTALNTVSNIASELFGVKPAAAEEAPQRDVLGDLYTRTEPFGGEEIMSPFVGYASPAMSFPPRSQQQMLDALGIEGQPIGPLPTQREMLDALGIKGPTYEGLLPGQQKYQDRAPTTIQQAADITSGMYPANQFPITTFGRPEEMATYGAPRALPADLMSGLSSFDLSGVRQPVEEAAQVTEDQSPMDLSGLPVGQYARFDMPNAIEQFRQQLMDITVPSGLGFNVNAGVYANAPESGYYQTDEQIARTIMQNLPLAGLTLGPDGSIVTQEGGIPSPEQMSQVVSLASQPYTAPASAFPEGSTGTMTLTPSQFVNVQNIPLPPERTAEATAPLSSFGAVAPQETGLTSFEAALGALPRGTELKPFRAEVPSTPSTPMTTEQLKEFGVYKEPLKPNQTVRQNFEEAFADAKARGLDMFEWTNPVTGKSETYTTRTKESEGRRSTTTSTTSSKKASSPIANVVKETTPATDTWESPLSFAARARNPLPEDYETYAYQPEYSFYS